MRKVNNHSENLIFSNLQSNENYKSFYEKDKKIYKLLLEKTYSTATTTTTKIKIEQKNNS